MVTVIVKKKSKLIKKKATDRGLGVTNIVLKNKLKNKKS